MSDIPVWNCELIPSTEEGSAPLDALTVGAKFGIKCHGDIAVNWGSEPAHLAFAKPEEEFSLALLKVVRQDPSDVQYLVTSYKSGEFTPEYVRILQGSGDTEKGFETSKLKWQVKSVLDPKQPPTPVPPLGPFALQLPLWFILALAAVLMVILFMVGRLVRRYFQRKRMLTDLAKHRTPMLPLHQFYRDARQLRRRMHQAKDEMEMKLIAGDLEREFRLLLLREFQIPTLEWSNRSILSELHKRHRKVYRNSAEPLRRTLRELSKVNSNPKTSMQDLEQVYRMSLDTAEKLQAPSGGKL